MNALLAFWYAHFGGGLLTVPHPDYVFAWLEDSVFLAGDTRALNWQISRKDGLACPAPTTATITILDATGAILQSFGADTDPAPPANTQILGALWAVASVGTYTAEIVVGIGSDGQIRSDREIVVVR